MVISRLGRSEIAYLRAAMYVPALTAVRCAPYGKAFYESLVSRGKRKMQVIAAVMREYLAGICACIHGDEPFDTAKLFSAEHLRKA